MRLLLGILASVSVLSCGDPVSVSSSTGLPLPRYLDEVPPPCNGCILAPVTLTANKQEYVADFSAAPGEYQIVIDADDAPGGILDLTLNDEALPRIKSRKTPISGPTILGIKLDGLNRIRAVVTGRPDLRFRFEIPRPLPLGPCKPSPIFSQPTTPVDQLRAVVPLGNLNPPEHVIPAPHIYMWPVGAGTAGRVPIHAPAFSRVVAIGVDEEMGDYYAYLTPCAGVRVYFIHIVEFAPRLARLVTTPFGGFRLGPGFFKLVVLDLDAGELVGYADRLRGPYDVGFVDTRRAPLAYANPARYSVPPEAFPPDIPPELVDAIAPYRLNQYCILDEYVPAVRAQLEGLLGRFDASARRTTAPLCGTQMQDVVGTAQGNWFTPDGGGLPERGRIGLLHDNVDPSLPVFSIGDDLPGWDSGAWRFALAGSGLVNRDFDDVVPGSVYCYDGVRSGPRDAGRVLLEVFGELGETANRLRVERQEGMACGAGPWSVTAAAVVFQR